jgi:DNA helicase-4
MNTVIALFALLFAFLIPVGWITGIVFLIIAIVKKFNGSNSTNTSHNTPQPVKVEPTKRKKKNLSETDKNCDQYIQKIIQVENILNAILEQYPNQIIAQDDYVMILNKINGFLQEVNAQLFHLRRAYSIRELQQRCESLHYSIYIFPDRVKQHNDFIWQQRINDVSSTIGNVEGNPLDNQQLLCIAKTERNHLVLAGAGTGKTTTIVGKIKYLLNKGWMRPEDILVLSFTNASAAEMNERIRKETGQNVDASTFHKLGLNILTKANGTVPKISNIDVKKFIQESIRRNMNSPKYYYKLANYLFHNRIVMKSEFDFDSDEAYHNYLQLNPPKTMREESVKSYGEMEIANFLYQNKINYQYEHDYVIDTRDESHAQYRPDFYLPDYDIYIEYFGIDRMGNVPAFFSGKDGKSASDVYNESIEWKRKTHASNNTKMIECFAYEKSEGHLLDALQEKLIQCGVQLNPMSSDEIWEQVCKDDQHILDGIVDLFETVVNLLKSNRCSINDARNLNTFGYGYAANKQILDLIEPIFNDYQQALLHSNMIDFNDMINKAIDAVNANQYVHNYKLVIVDEYQDISKQRFLLLDSMRKQKGYELFCVGDDWQSIYRFAGSDIDFILNFEKYWGPTEISKIETTYRFSQSLIDVSGSFVMNNPEQIKKSIKGKSPSVGFSVGEICGYTEEYAMRFLATRLHDLPQNSSVFFIGRYSCDVKMLQDSKLFKCKYNNATGVIDVVYEKRKDLKMSFITAHKSKGLQADYVFIINNKKGRMGFPSEIQNASILELLLEGYGSYPFAEERRLFYVALTRARKKALLVTLANRESIFTKELQSKYGDRMRKEAFECPLCGANLEKKNGPYGEFFGCSNYHKTGCRFTRKIQKFQE